MHSTNVKLEVRPENLAFEKHSGHWELGLAIQTYERITAGQPLALVSDDGRGQDL